MITVHMILHAHLDPIWLWPWQAGLDEALATCRSACDRLDHNPDAIFTQGEAWVYQQVEWHDPELFARIAAHVEAGRWEITGGWWIQPDCNAPGGLGFRRQIDLGKRYFLDRFGQFPEVAFNTDSFGHAATLPGLMADAGQKFYVMMRPGEHEMALPARLFRWRGYADGPEVLTFRIARSYNAADVREEHIRAAVEGLPPGVHHTMCFAGIGDHGGGPSESLIAAIREKADAFEGLRLCFSSPSRFFAAVEAEGASLPTVTGELQHHAIGCYTVQRSTRLGVKLGEQALAQAEIALRDDPSPPLRAAAELEDRWRDVAFMHFHDTLGGTCLPSAYRQVDACLGGVRAFADRVMHSSLRRQLAGLPDDPLQRLVFYHGSDRPFDDWVEAEPWMGQRGWPESFRLLDEKVESVAFQFLRREAVVGGAWPGRIGLRLRAEPGEMRVLRIVESGPEAAVPAHPVSGDSTSAGNGMIMADLTRGISTEAARIPLPGLQLLPDASDTWSHGLDRYAEGPALEARWEAPVLTARGTLLHEISQTGRIGDSEVLRQVRLGANDAFVELRYRITWCEHQRIAKLRIDLPARPCRRIDGIPGGHLERACDGAERPIRDWILLRFDDGMSLALVCPEVFALDASDDRIRLTLLRSPLMAHHDPHPGGLIEARTSDRGEHDVRIRVLMKESMTPEELDDMAAGMLRPPVYADWTKGMPAHV